MLCSGCPGAGSWNYLGYFRPSSFGLRDSMKRIDGSAFSCPTTALSSSTTLSRLVSSERRWNWCVSPNCSFTPASCAVPGSLSFFFNQQDVSLSTSFRPLQIESWSARGTPFVALGVQLWCSICLDFVELFAGDHVQRFLSTYHTIRYSWNLILLS